MTSFHVPFFGRCCGMALCHIVGTSQFGVSPGRLERRDCMTRHESIVARTRKSVLTSYSAKYDRNMATDLYVSLRPYEHSMRICNSFINFATFTIKRLKCKNLRSAIFNEFFQTRSIFFDIFNNRLSCSISKITKLRKNSHASERVVYVKFVYFVLIFIWT